MLFPPIIHSSLFVLALLVWPISTSAKTNPPGDSALNVRSAEEVIEKWTPEQHLYVKGDLGISPEQLGNLEQWLDENGRHWTVVLLRQADDETYTALDNRKFFGMDAVEYALGHGLHNRTDFGSLLNDKTKETDGAVFVLFLVERKFSYYGSDVHDRRALGESKWIGDLDGEAIRAMRSGGRIIDAVKNTVASVNSRLEKKLAAEDQARERAAAAAERAKLEQRRALENQRLRLSQMREEMTTKVESAARNLRANFPKAAESKLAQPPVAAWQKRLDDLDRDLSKISGENNDAYQQTAAFRNLIQSTNQVRGDVDYYLDLYAAHAAFKAMVAPVEQQLDLIADDPSGAAAKASDEAYRILDEARSSHERGEVAFAGQIQQVKDLVAQGEQAIELEKQRVRKEQERQQLIWRTLSIAASALGAVLLGLLWFFNLRRRPALRRAHEAFDRRSKIVEAELESSDALLKRTEEVVGSAAAFADKKFVGDTLELGNKTIARAQSLREMIDEVNSVIGSAYQLLHPANPIAEFANMFSGARYEYCVGLLNGESLRLASRDGAELQTGSSPALVTFDRFFQAMGSQVESTRGMLDTLEHALDNINPQIEQLRSRFLEATELEHELSRSARLDRHFRVPSLFEKLLPAVREDCDRASGLAEHDPVKAIAGPVTGGLRKLADALSVAGIIQTARADVFPQLETASGELRSLGFDIRWIDESVSRLGERADQLITETTRESTAEKSQQFGNDVTQLGLRARRCVELAQNIAENAAPALVQLQNEIQQRRQEISGELKIDSGRVLHEPNYDPDVELEQARKQLQSARAALDYGGVESVMESLDELNIETATARDFLAASLAAVKDFEADFADRESKHRKLADDLPRYRKLIEAAQSNYAPSALVLREQVDSSNEPAPSDSILDYQSRAGGLLELAPRVLGEARDLHFSGKVLEGANLLQLVHGDFAMTDQLLAQIKEHCTWLDNQSRENRIELERRLKSLQNLSTSARDPRTQQASLGCLEKLSQQTTELELDFESQPTHRDPFDDLQRMAGLIASSQELDAMIEADRRAHAAAQNAISGANAGLVAAKKSVIQSETDRIPDSQAIKRAQELVKRYERELRELGNGLQAMHGDWRYVSEKATHFTGELGVIDGQLRRELQLAQTAAAQLNVASQQVFETASWQGAYGIGIIGNPGSQQLEVSRQYLAQGNYDASIESSRLAIFNARQALDVAQRQVENRRSDIARQAAEDRRRRQSSFVSLGGSSFGSSSFGSSSRSSSSSFGGGSSRSSSSSSRSSSGASGSGFSRSGW